MLSLFNLQRRVALASLLALALAAGCSSSIAPVSPAPTPAPPSISRSEARIRLQAGIVAVTGVEAAALLAAVAQSLERPVQHPHCSDGIQNTIKPTPDGVLETIDVFYDASCAHLLAHAVLNTLQFVPGRVTIATRFETQSIDGTPVASGKSISTTIFSQTGSQSMMKGFQRLGPGNRIETFGLTCTLKGAGGDCGFGAVTNAKAERASLGFTATIGGFAGARAGTGTIAIRSYRGSLGTLGLAAGSGNAWIVTGGTAVARQAGTYTQSAVTGSLRGRYSITLAQAGGPTVSIVSIARSGLTGSLAFPTSTSPAAALATDAAGSGAIDYAGRFDDPVRSFVIRG